MSVFTRILSSSQGASITGSIEHLGDFLITGSIQANQADGTSAFELTRNDGTISAGNKLGEIKWSGMDPSTGAPHTGAMIEAVAAQSWVGSFQQGTDLKFWIQSQASGDDQFAKEPILTLSSSTGRGEFLADLYAGEKMYAKAGMQIGTSYDNVVADNTNGVLRVSARETPVYIDIDPGVNIQGGIRFLERGYSAPGSGNPAIVVDRASATNGSGNAEFAIKLAEDDNSEGVIKVNSGFNSVQIGGGNSSSNSSTRSRNATYCLVVTGSSQSRDSSILLTSNHAITNGANAAFLTFDHNTRSSSSNGSDAFHFGINPRYDSANTSDKTLVVTNAALASSSPTTIYEIMTWADGGSTARVGIGGTTSSGAATQGSSHVRSINPTGSLHVEHRNTSVHTLSSGLEHTTLLLGNSSSGANELYNRIAFDISQDNDKEKHTADITVSNDSATDEHTGILSIAMYDGSGNTHSTRTRLRMDHQGATIIMSGTSPASGGGFPRSAKSYYETDLSVGGTPTVPTGSLTLMALCGDNVSLPNVSPTLSFVQQTATGGGLGPVIGGDELGRIQWWSGDSGGSYIDGSREGAFIRAVATQTHGSLSQTSPSKIEFWTRGQGSKATTTSAITKAMQIEDSGIVTFYNGTNIASGDFTVAGDIQVNGNNIKDAGGSNGITFDGSGNTAVDGNLTVGGDIIGPTDASLDIKSDGNVNIHLDDDNDGTNNFKVVNGANGALLTILEASGDTTVAGDLTINGNNIKDSGGSAGITFDGSGNTAIDGRLNFAEYGRLVSGADLGTDGEWIKIATLQDPVTNTQGASSVAIQVTIVGRQNFTTSHAQCLKQATIHLSHENDGGTSGMGTPAFYVDIISALSEAGFGGATTAWTKDDFILTHATSSPFNAEIWVKAEANAAASNLEAYASIVGGSTGEQQTSSYVNYWKLNTGQSWAGSAANLGAQITAEYPTRPVGYLYSEEGITIGKSFYDSSDRYVKIKVGSSEKAGITLTETTNSAGTGELGTSSVYGFEIRYDGDANDLEFVRGEQTTLNTPLRITREDGHIYAIDTASNTDSGSTNMHIDLTTGEIHRSTSDRRGKKEIAELTSSLDDICKLIPRQFYDVKDENNENLIPGFVSDEVESVIPLLVPDRNISDPEIYRSVSYDRVCAYIVNALKEIKQRLEDLESNS